MAIMGRNEGRKLIEVLGLPKHTRSFSIHFAVNAAVTKGLK